MVGCQAGKEQLRPHLRSRRFTEVQGGGLAQLQGTGLRSWARPLHNRGTPGRVLAGPRGWATGLHAPPCLLASPLAGCCPSSTCIPAVKTTQISRSLNTGHHLSPCHQLHHWLPENLHCHPTSRKLLCKLQVSAQAGGFYDPPPHTHAPCPPRATRAPSPTPFALWRYTMVPSYCPDSWPSPLSGEQCQGRTDTSPICMPSPLPRQ